MTTQTRESFEIQIIAQHRFELNAMSHLLVNYMGKISGGKSSGALQSPPNPHMSFLLLVGTRDVRTQSARAQPAHARLMFLPGFGCTYESVGARFLPPLPPPKKKKKFGSRVGKEAQHERM